MPSLDDAQEYRERVATRAHEYIVTRGLTLTREHIEQATDYAVRVLPNPGPHPRPNFTSAEVQSARPAFQNRAMGVKRVTR